MKLYCSCATHESSLDTNASTLSELTISLTLNYERKIMFSKIPDCG